MIKLNNIIFAFLSIITSQVAVASAINPSVIAFNEGQLIQVNLSDTDINRISVVGDQVSNVRCPGNICAVSFDKSDNTGSVYVNIGSSSPFTMFITTAQDRNFSLLVTPQAVPGETYVFQPMNSGMNASGWEKNSDYEDLNVNIIADLVNNQPPDSFGYQQCSSDTPCPNMKAQKAYSVIKMTPVAEYDGDAVIGVVYQLTNTGKEPFTAPPAAYYNSGVRAISLQKQTLQAGESGDLYEVITNPNANLGD